MLSNEKYMWAVDNIMQYALNLNERSPDHFPVMAVSYGYLAMIQPHIISPEKYYEPFPTTTVGDSLATNFVYGTADTYLYDELLHSEAEDMLDDVTFYNQVNKGIRLGNFKPVQRKLSLLYLPILTFHEEKVN